MPNTYTLIASFTVTSPTGNITFSSIPSTYNDLNVLINARSDVASNRELVRLWINGDTSAIYARNGMIGAGSAGRSVSSGSNMNSALLPFVNGNNATSSSFGSMRIYIPAYKSTRNKTVTHFGASEDASTEAWLSGQSTVYASNSPITSLVMFPENGTVWQANTKFWLYGISNS